MKWDGLRRENLDRHGLSNDKPLILKDANDDTFNVNSLSCALCMRNDDNCSKCPMTAARLGVPCDQYTCDEVLSPWDAWFKDGDPEPMIKALKLKEKALLIKK